MRKVRYFSQHVNSYFDDELDTVKDVTDSTYESYLVSLTLLIKELAAQLKKPASMIMASDIEFDVVRNSMLKLSRERQWGPNTWNLRLSGIKGFCRYLAMMDVHFLDFSRRVDLLSSRRAPKVERQTISEEELHTVLESFPTRNWNHYRDKTMLMFMFYTGVRAEEVTGLNKDDLRWINSAELHLNIFGKGRKNRRLPLIEPSALKNLRKYLSITKFEHEFIFCTKHGGRMGTDNVRRVVSKHFRDFDSQEKITPHTLRRSAATRWLSNGADLKTVSALLGHESVSTTENYTKTLFVLKENAMKEVASNDSKGRLMKMEYSSNDEFLESLHLRSASSRFKNKKVA